MFLCYAVLFYLSSVSSSKLGMIYIQEDNTLELLLQEIMVKSLEPRKCVMIVTDTYFAGIFGKSWFKRFGAVLTFLLVIVEEYEDLYAPSNSIQSSLSMARNEGCQLYIILLLNGIQVSRLLQFGDRYREINTHAKYILLHDKRLFDKKMFYIWKRIINVVFLRKYELSESKFGNYTRYEISTVPFPVAIEDVLIPWRLDVWMKSRFMTGSNLFRDKTYDLRKQILKVTTIRHIPGTAVTNVKPSSNRASFKMYENEDSILYFYGTEIEILQTISKVMNFHCDIYEPENAEFELWGRRISVEKYTGILGEMAQTGCDIALGNLYYTPYLLDLMDLTIGYNTECLTFLTPESQTDNSWKTLILPFSPIMWITVILCLVVCILIFHYIARFYKLSLNSDQDSSTLSSKEFSQDKKHTLILSIYNMDMDNKYAIMKKINQTTNDKEATGLYQFGEPTNSALYTYSMLLLVSLPKLPIGWSLRILTGWYWLYCLLVVTSYRASMTAILARPTAKVTIDTLEQLISSKLTYGGCGELNREFFKYSSDPIIQMISNNFMMVNSSEEAINKVAESSFAFYENIYFLKEAIVKQRDKMFQSTNISNSTQMDTQKETRNLHIMNDCVINVPASLGLQKNSPLKPRMDKIIRRIVEAGLIKKWMDDVMQKVLISDMESENTDNLKALMNMRKFSGAMVALGIGYFLSIITLCAELLYFHFFTVKNPYYNKYSRKIEV